MLNTEYNVGVLKCLPVKTATEEATISINIENLRLIAAARVCCRSVTPTFSRRRRRRPPAAAAAGGICVGGALTTCVVCLSVCHRQLPSGLVMS